VLPGRARKSGTVAGFDRVGRSLTGRRIGEGNSEEYERIRLGKY
jgi:hypothetical protein